ncbi:MAG: hypothetical protein KDI90_07955 [Alphaproteobacteria bacterium]|nr:hypothetical protein [Alphaproteobacteria bacterium]
MDNDRLSSGFASADAKGFGLSGSVDEVTVMLRENMDLAQASAFHLRHWGLTKEFDLEHDIGHILMALSKALPGVPSDYPYQADYEAEIYTVALQMTLLDSMSGKPAADADEIKTRFLQRVQDNYDIYGPSGNLNRVVIWALRRVADIDGEQPHRAGAYKDAALYQFAENHGVEITQDHETWGVDIPALDERFWYVDDRKHYLPDDIEEVTDFNRFARPSAEQAGAMYERLRPGLTFLTDFLDEAFPRHRDSESTEQMRREALGGVKVRDLNAAMLSGFTPPAPEQDAGGAELRA